MLSFGLFSDVHYADKVYGNRYCRDAPVKLRACIDEFNARGLPLAFCLGDLIDTVEDRAADLHALQTISAVFADFRGARHVAIGNHDLERLTKAEFRAHCGGTPPYYSFTLNGVHFVVLDGNCHADGRDFAAGDFTWDRTWMSEAQRAWLARDLAAARDLPVIVCAHENIDPRDGLGDDDLHVLRDAAAVRAVLEEAGNVRAVLQGHYHPGALAHLNGIPYLTMPAMVTGASGEHTAFAIVTVHADGALSVEGFGAQTSLRL